MLSAAVVTTFPDNSWQVYSEQMLKSFVHYWPQEIPILIKLDTDSLAANVSGIIRSFDGLKCGFEPEQQAFVDRNKGKDDPENYRKQAVRFSHKVFALKYALDAVERARAAKEEGIPRHLIWLDADVLTTRQVTINDIEACLPKDGDAVSYMGRKDWPHSECGWLAFDLENGGNRLIEAIHKHYVDDKVFEEQQWDDSWIFDQIVKQSEFKATNLTADAKGMEVWPQSPMASWSRHYKGPIAKQELLGKEAKKTNGTMQPLKIQTKNSIPDGSICKNIEENQTLITNWLSPCEINEEEIVVVSAGPMLIAEDLQHEVDAGHKIVAVKHALKPLKEAGIRPWATILLDPRPHVYNFIDEIDQDIICFVASQVDPKVVKALVQKGCKIWGYHASVGANEGELTEKQAYAVVEGGSATSTRGLFVLDKLGFKKFRLYGYDLCFAQKPDLNERDEIGQPKNFEIEIGYRLPHYKDFRWFWSKGELLAQADEFRQIMELNKWKISAFGNGIVPFLANIRRINDLRLKKKLAKMTNNKPLHYEDMLGCKNKTLFSASFLKTLLKIPRKLIKASSF